MSVVKYEQGGSIAADGSKKKSYMVKKGNGPALLAEYTHNVLYEGLGYYNSSSSSVSEQPGYDRVELVFGATRSTSSSNTVKESGYTEYNISTGTMDQAIERHPNYRVNWNYQLWQYVPEDGSAPSSSPAWWLDAVDMSDTDGEANPYMWSKDMPSGAKGSKASGGTWVKLCNATKPGVEAYMIPTTIITKTIYYTDRESAEAAVAAVGTLSAPGKTFGLNTAAGCWMVTNSNIGATRKNYTVTTEYTYYALGWDSEIYPIPTTTTAA